MANFCQALQPKKFHLRAYCVAEGAPNVYLFPKILALSSSVPYSNPSSQEGDETTIDLRPHLTNSALQTELGEENDRLLTELVGSTILSGTERRNFTEVDGRAINRSSGTHSGRGVQTRTGLGGSFPGTIFTPPVY